MRSLFHQQLQYHVTFLKVGHIESLGKLAPFANSSATDLVQYYDSSDSKYLTVSLIPSSILMVGIHPYSFAFDVSKWTKGESPTQPLLPPANSNLTFLRSL